ncbi:hypothetical protein AB1K70_24940, partial [Bremerella sp. JC770]|uniref:hypothetical protein n=1 Tax=Bremerella sp. JC770 TaxID=3232137 RepID=UPI003458890B
ILMQFRRASAAKARGRVELEQTSESLRRLRNVLVEMNTRNNLGKWDNFQLVGVQDTSEICQCLSGTTCSRSDLST